MNEIDREFDKDIEKEIRDIKDNKSNFTIDIDGRKVHNNENEHMEIVEEANLTIQEMFSKSNQKRFKSNLDTENWIIPGMPGGIPPKQLANNDNQKEESKSTSKERKDTLLWLTSDSDESDDDNEIRRDLDEEEIKEIKEMENIEGMLDDDGLQNELAITESENSNEEIKDEDNSTTQSKSKEWRQKQFREESKKETISRPQYTIPIENNDDGEEWILDHTGIRRKPFKVMHREIREIQ